jgi:hypothetical protein
LSSNSTVCAHAGACGKQRLGGITKAGNRYLRQMLVVGAMAVIRYAERHGTRRPWLVQLLARKKAKVAAVALANKTARIVWALMTRGETYREPSAGQVAAAKAGRKARRGGWEGQQELMQKAGRNRRTSEPWSS